MIAGIVSALGLCLLTSCSHVKEEQTLLPWFKTRITVSPDIGGLHNATETMEYFVKTHGFWHKLDDVGVGGAVALNPDTVFFYSQGKPKIIHRDERSSRFVCEGPLPVATVPPGSELIDCVNPMAGPALAVATQIRFRRLTASGQVVNDKAISVDAPARVFLQPRVTFYDDRHTAYLVTLNERFSSVSDCALIAVDSGDPRLVVGPTKMLIRDCSEESVWAKLVQQRLKHVP